MTAARGPSTSSRQNGFTLIELMVALAVFALTAMIGFQHSSRSLTQQKILEDTSLALWIAENHLAQLRIAKFPPSLGQSEEEIIFAERQWILNSRTQKSPTQGILEIEITVTTADQQPSTQASLTGYIGNWR